ncbi:MAG: PhoU domain-containing protein [Candidatus Methanomethylicaceae archaeon]|nr:PhoU domain-containing protein [Candidatus Verstraetearchaeota archaeon]
MEYRRLQRSKGGSFLLSLPKDWVKKNGLDAGSIIRLSEGEGGALLISLEAGGESEKGSTAVIRDPEGIERQIRAQYLLGVDSIVIDLGRRMTPSIRNEVKEAIRKLIGLEIVEEEANSMTVQCLLQPTSMPVRSTLRRAYSLAANMHREAEEALMKGDVELAEAVSKRDEEVDRLYFLLVRQLRLAIRNQSIAEKLGVRPAECLDLRMAAKYVETIADYSEAVANSVRKLSGEETEGEIMEALLSLSRTAYKIHEEASQALFKGDIKLADQVLLKNQELTEKLLAVSELLLAKQPRLSAIIDSVSMYLYQIGAHGIDIAELVGGENA